MLIPHLHKALYVGSNFYSIMDSNKQYIYILTNQQFEGLLKIGRTDRHPIARAKQLSSQTGVVGTFLAEWYLKVPDSSLAERMAHFKLKKYHHEKEFYKVELSIAISTIEAAISPFFDLKIDTKDKLEDIHDAIEGLKLLLDDPDPELIRDVTDTIEDLEEKFIRLKHKNRSTT